MESQVACVPGNILIGLVACIVLIFSSSHRDVLALNGRGLGLAFKCTSFNEILKNSVSHYQRNFLFPFSVFSDLASISVNIFQSFAGWRVHQPYFEEYF